MEVIITDPKKRGTLEHNNELVVFMGKCEDNQDVVCADGYNLYINGELGVKNIAPRLFK